MAQNRIKKDGYRDSVVCSSPTTPASGDPIRYGDLTGVALTDESADGNASGYTSVDFGPSVWNVYVDDDAATGIAVGDPIYYHDTATGSPATHLNNNATSYDAFFGVAQETVSTNGTAQIKVLHVPVGATVALANNAVDTAQIADGAVTAAKLDSSAVDGLGVLRAARFTFDPSANSGQRTQAAHGLGVTLPDNALVLYGIIEILTTFADGASDNATIALSIQSANDLVTATAISSGTFWDAVKAKVVVPDALNAAGVATPIKLTAAREITATVGVHDLTAGKLVGWLFYVIGD